MLTSNTQYIKHSVHYLLLGLHVWTWIGGDECLGWTKFWRNLKGIGKFCGTGGEFQSDWELSEA
jgi:hypothetical protein